MRTCLNGKIQEVFGISFHIFWKTLKGALIPTSTFTKCLYQHVKLLNMLKQIYIYEFIFIRLTVIINQFSYDKKLFITNNSQMPKIITD